MAQFTWRLATAVVPDIGRSVAMGETVEVTDPQVIERMLQNTTAWTQVSVVAANITRSENITRTGTEDITRTAHIPTDAPHAP